MSLSGFLYSYYGGRDKISERLFHDFRRTAFRNELLSEI
jgi:hypothetical protein